MSKQPPKPPPLTSAELLAGRRFEDLSSTEQANYRQMRETEGKATVQRIVDNLNTHTATRH